MPRALCILAMELDPFEISFSTLSSSLLSPKYPGLPAQIEESLLHDAHLHIHSRLAAHQKKAAIWGYFWLMQAIALTEDPLDTISDHRIAKLLAGCKADSAFRSIFRKDVKNQIPVRIGTSAAINPLKVGSAL